MSTITKERLEQLANFRGAPVTRQEEQELARIALASLEAGPAIHRWRRVTSEPYGPYPWHYGDFIGFSKPVDGIEDEYFYSAPPAPAPVSDEDKVLAEQARAVIHCLDMCGVPSGDYADNEQLQLWGRVIEYGRHPASVSVPDYPDVLPCPVMLEPGLRFGKGVPTKAMLGALQRRSEYYAELDAMTPEQRDEHDAGIREFATMLKSFGNSEQLEPVTTAYKLRDAVETIRNSGIAIDAEKIFAERDALNSPVIPDGWKLVPIDPTKDMLRAGQSVVGFWLNTVHCYSKMLAAAPAAPQQEVKP